MASEDAQRFIPAHLNKRDMTRCSVGGPDWFLREAVEAHRLPVHEVAIFLVICDSLNYEGVARVASSVLVRRTGMGRSTALRHLGSLVDRGLLIRLDSELGGINRWAVPRRMPPPPERR